MARGRDWHVMICHDADRFLGIGSFKTSLCNKTQYLHILICRKESFACSGRMSPLLVGRWLVSRGKSTESRMLASLLQPWISEEGVPWAKLLYAWPLFGRVHPPCVVLDAWPVLVPDKGRRAAWRVLTGAVAGSRHRRGRCRGSGAGPGKRRWRRWIRRK